MSENTPNQPAGDVDNLSEEVFKREFDGVYNRLRRAHFVSDAVKKAAATLGISAAILLALIGAQDPPSDPKEPPQTNYDQRTYTFGSDASGEADTHPIVVSPTVQIGPVQSIQGAPPLTVAWHRTRLSQGDKFWALPDARFELELLHVENCSGAYEDCTARFGATLTQNNGERIEFRDAFVVSGRTINSENFATPSNGELCFEQLDEVLTPTTHCAIDSSLMGFLPADDESNICISIRRSEVPEDADASVSAREAVAIDIRWWKFTPPDTCPADGVGTQAHSPGPIVSGG